MPSSTPKKQAQRQEAGRPPSDTRTGAAPRPEENVLQQHIAHHHLKVTREREVVLRAFLAAERHVSAEELHRQIREAGESIGLATVYRALNLFCECGLAEPRQFGDGFTRYEMTYNVRHHDHLICTQCHTIIEFENPDIEELQEKVAKRNHFTVYRHKLEMYGLCQACVAAPKPSGHF